MVLFFFIKRTCGKNGSVAIIILPNDFLLVKIGFFMFKINSEETAV